MRRDERVTVQGPVKEQQPDGMSHGGGGAEVRNLSQFSAAIAFCLSPSRARWCPALCVPCAEMLLLEASRGLVTAPQFSRNFSP